MKSAGQWDVGAHPANVFYRLGVALLRGDVMNLRAKRFGEMKVIGDLWRFLEQKTAERLEA